MGATMVHRVASAGSLLMLAAGALLIPTSTASAAERDGVCDSGEVCLYYNSNGQGSVSDFKDVGWRRSVSTSSVTQSEARCPVGASPAVMPRSGLGHRLALM